MGTGYAPGKVILVGEHFVVHGTPAIALPLASRGVHVRVVREPGAWTMPQRVAEHLTRLLEELGEDPGALSIEVTSTLPIGAGLGGSAAIAVALVRALYAEEELSDDAVRTLAHRLERLAHGNPSGVDDAVAAYACPVRYISGEAPEPLVGVSVPSLWVALSRERTSTMEAVARVRALSQSKPTWFAGLLEDAQALTDQAHAHLKRGAWPELGALLTENHHLLDAVGVSTAQLDQLVNSALDAGAYGAKLTGGGLGGAVIALCPEALDLDEVWQNAGAQEVMRT